MQTLVKRRSDGGIQEWSIEVQGNGFRVTAGKQGRKQRVNEWTYCKGKNQGKSNETTDEQQAEVEAKSKWKKKLDGEYALSLDKVDDIGYVKPMLAHKWEDYSTKVDFPLYAQPKLDGIRCIIDKNGMKTRTGKPIVAVPHIFESLKPFFEKWPFAILDGELYCDKFENDFNSICHHVKRSNVTPETLEKSKVIEYHVYDLVSGWCGEFAKFSQRISFVQHYLTGYDYIVPVETCMAEGAAALDELYGKWVEKGYEGQMIRLDKTYENKRSKSLLKRKEFQDAEYTILGHGEGIGNRSGTVGHLHFETPNKTPFHSNVKGTFEYLSDLLKDADSLVGKQATIKYFGLTPDGVPRFPYVVAIRDYE